MQPVLKETIWGDTRLAEMLGKAGAEGRRIGESWELADHPHGTTRIANGKLAGRTLREVLRQHGPAILGRKMAAQKWGDRFGLLVKFIDATDRLSVQVHPDDAYAAAHVPGELGKTECWVVLRADPQAWLIRGLAPGTTREAFAKAVKEGRTEEHLLKRPVKAGDFVWVPAGAVHAIGAGIVLAEIQQNSDITYRLHDWGRKGDDGKPRTLHLREAMETIRFGGEEPPSGGRGRTAEETGLVVDHLVDCHAFSLSRMRLDRRPWAGETDGAFAVLVVIGGQGRLATSDTSTDLVLGDTVLVPADVGEYVFETPGTLEVLIAAPPGMAPTE
jgi:mannose-6-phosphate isomerase